MIHVHIVDDHAMMVELLVPVINGSGFAHVAGHSLRLSDCRKALAAGLPDVLLLDINMPDGDGIVFCAEVHKLYPKMKIIALTGHGEYSGVMQMLRGGASGYILKSEAVSEVIEAIHAVTCGEVYISRQMEQVIRRTTKMDISLTPREKQVLQLVAEAKSNPQIAKQLDVGLSTVLSFRKRLNLKLKASNPVELLANARKEGLLVLFLFSFFVLYAQVNIDSLKNVLETQQLSDEEKTEIYLDISKFYSYNNYDSCIAYSNRGILFAGKSNKRKLLATFNNLLGLSYYQKSSYDTSYVYLTKYLEMAVELKDKELEMSAYGSLGTMYRYRQDFQASVENYMKALGVSDTISRMRAVILVNTGTVYRIIQHWDLAGKYLQEALVISDKLNLDEIKMGASHTLGNVYLDRNVIDSALIYFEKSLELSRKQNNRQYELISIQSLGVSYSILQEYDSAIKYGHEALAIAEDFGNDKAFISSWLSMSEVYREAKQYENSEEMALKAWAMDSTSLSEGAYAAFNLALANIHLGNKQKAEYYLTKFQEIMFHGNDKQMKESLANMEVKYQTEKKETRIATLEEERKLYIGLGIALVAAFLLGIGLLYYRHRAIVQKHKIDAEKAEREVIARDLHDGVGAMLSVVRNNMGIMKYDKALDVLDKSIAELRRVSHHIMPATLIDKGLAVALDDFCRSIPEVEFHSPESHRRFHPEKELVLYRCAYELVNNALRHASASRIDVHLNMDDKTAYLSVVDNGRGFDPQVVQAGMGLANMRLRLATYGGRLEIFSAEGKGTEANVEIGA